MSEKSEKSEKAHEEKAEKAKGAESRAAMAARAGLPTYVGETLVRCETCGEKFQGTPGGVPPHQLQPGWLCAGSGGAGVVVGQR